MKELKKLNELHEIANNRADKIDSLLDSIRNYKHETETAPSTSDLIYYIGLEIQSELDEFYKMQTTGLQAIEELKQQPTKNQTKKEAK